MNTIFNLRLSKELVDMKSLQKYTDKTQKWSGGKKAYWLWFFEEPQFKLNPASPSCGDLSAAPSCSFSALLFIVL